MSRLTDISIRVEHTEGSLSNLLVATQVLRQIQRLLARFLETGEPGTIDLRAQPHMEPETYRHLRQALMTGEVTALVDADIKVEVTETQYSGVWWLTHRNADSEIVTEVLDITLIPDILKTHVAEMRAGLKRLDQALSASAA
jgi:hydrogenase-1 operon protein HyaF